MALVKGKGTQALWEISSVYTAIPQVISIDVSGEKSETYSGRTLDGAVHDAQPSNGYVSNPTIKMELFWDSAHASHAKFKTDMRTPPAAGVNLKLIDVSGTPVTEIWNCTGIGVDVKTVTNEGVKATVTLMTSGNPS
jgi:hypothetical protein